MVRSATSAAAPVATPVQPSGEGRRPVEALKAEPPLPPVLEERILSRPSHEDFDLERGSSTSSISLGDMAGAGQNEHYKPGRDIITRLEHLGEKDMKVAPLQGPPTPFLSLSLK